MTDDSALTRRRFASGALAGASLLVAGLPTSRPATAYNRTEPVLARQLGIFFDRLALLHERRGRKDSPGWVRKWRRPVRVRVRGLRAVEHLDDIDTALETISGLTGLVFRRSDKRRAGEGMATIYYVNGREMRQKFGRSTPYCMTSTWGRAGRIDTGRIMINQAFADCLRHELMHLVGFDNHWPGARIGLPLPSLLAGRHSPDRAPDFSMWDRLAIRILYDSRLKPGLRRAEAQPIADRIIREMFNLPA